MEEPRKEFIKETKYCQILAQGKVVDAEYTYCIEKVFVKEKKREEIRFSLYKDTLEHVERYIPRSLDVTELEFLELFREGIKHEVFSKELLFGLKTILNQKKPSASEMKKREKEPIGIEGDEVDG